MYSGAIRWHSYIIKVTYHHHPFVLSLLKDFLIIQMSQQNCHQFSLKPPGGEMFPSVTPTCKSVIFPESEAENQSAN